MVDHYSYLQPLPGPSDSEISADLADLQGGNLPTGSGPTPSSPATAPVIAGTVANQSTTAEASVKPFSDVTLSDDNTGATDTLTIVMEGVGGTLSGAGLTVNADGSYTLAAKSADTLTRDLHALTFVSLAGPPSKPSTTTFTLTDRSSAGTSTTNRATTVVDTAAPPPSSVPTITGTRAGQASTAEASLAPFAAVTLSDADAGATDTLTIAVSGAGGTPSAAGLIANADGTYAFAAASPDTITRELDALTFTPLAGPPGQPSTTTFTLVDRSSAGTSATDATTTVADTAAPPGQPTIVAVPGQIVQAPSDVTVQFGAQDGGEVKGDGTDKGVTLVWSATSGNAVGQWWGNGNFADGSDPSKVVLSGLTPSDVTLSRTPDDRWPGEPDDNLTITNKATGKSLTLYREFSGYSGDGAGSIQFADRTTLSHDQIAAASPILAVPGQRVMAPSDVTVQFGPQDGGEIKGDGTDKGVKVVWSATSGNAVAQWWGNGNFADGSDPNRVVLAGLNPSDVTLTRTPDDRWPGEPDDNLTITNTATGKTLVLYREFSGYSGDGAGSIQFADGSVLSHDQIAAASPILAVPGQIVQAPSDVTIQLGAQDGGEIKGDGTDKGVTLVWSATSGNAVGQWWGNGNFADGSDPSKVVLSGLDPSDVTLTRNPDDRWLGDPDDNLTITNNATGKSLTLYREFSGYSGDGAGSIQFADGSVLSHDQIAAAAPIIAVPGHAVQAPSDVTVQFGTQDGGEIKGDGTDKGVTLVWSATSGNAVGQWWGNGNFADGSDPSRVVLAGLNPSDVTLTRTPDDRWPGEPDDNLTITNNATGKTLTLYREFSGYSGDGAGSIQFADGTTLNHDQIAAQTALHLSAGVNDATLEAPNGDAVLTAGRGNDTFVAGDGNDTFVYAAACGNLTIGAVHQTGWGNDADTLQLTDLNPGDVGVLRRNDDLLLAIAATGRVIDVSSQFDAGGQDGIAQIHFADGVTWSRADIAQRLPSQAQANGYG